MINTEKQGLSAKKRKEPKGTTKIISQMTMIDLEGVYLSSGLCIIVFSALRRSPIR